MDPLLASRYELRAPVGKGAMGEVWEALDTERGVTVALKKLREVDADGVYRLKQEFRARADIAHPNLVSLYELVADETDWFLTMELIDGMPLLDWIRGEDWRPVARSTASSETMNPATFHTPLGSETYRAPAEEASDSWTPEIPPDRAETPPPSLSPDVLAGRFDVDVERLRDAFRQLAEGVAALHASDRLHRDLKPANVLVTREGRVVLVDFGLAAELRGGATRAERGMAGTAAYMAPEQAMAAALTPSSDWYAVGVMLFEALTGLRPFHGSIARIIADKQVKSAPRPSDHCDGVPEDLDALAHRLMSRDPSDRPETSRVLAVLGAGEARQRSRVLVGRSRHLRRLDRSWKRARKGTTSVACVRGRSGMGKSVLVGRFLDSVDATTLSGRCYEGERVPYNAFDDLVDEIAERLFEQRMSIQVPEGAGALRKVFPGLDRLPEFAAVAVPDTADAQEIRSRAFRALAEVLTQLAPVVLHLDDVQWGDADSLALLSELLVHRPPMLVLLSYRDNEQTPFLDGLTRVLADEDVTEIEVGVLSPREALDFAFQLMGADADPDRARSIADESGGSPLFVEELARRARKGPVTSLDALIAERVTELPERQRRVVQLVALAGIPIPVRAVAKASSHEEPRPILDLLRAANLVRTSSDRVEPFHDRVRSAVSGLLVGDVRKEHHRMLAHALQEEDGFDPGALFRHWLGAGEVEQAVPWAVRAGEQAHASLAFDRAVDFYATALELGEWPKDKACDLNTRLGEALSLGGRAAEAGQIWLDASNLADDERHGLDLQRMAAEMFLEAGHTQQGLLVADRVLRTVGLRAAKHPRQAVVPLLGLRLRMWWRGLEPASGATPTEDDRFRMRVYMSMSRGLALVDFIQSEAFVYRHLLAALDAGDTQGAVRGLHSLAATLAAGGPRDRAKVPELLDRAASLADDSPETLAFLNLSRSMMSFADGDFEGTTSWADTAIDTLSDIQGMQFEVTTARLFSCWGLLFSGHLDRLSKQLPDWIRQARERGNQRFLATAETELYSAWALTEDRVEDAKRVMDECAARYDDQTFQLPQQSEMLGRQQVLQYNGEAVAAHRTMEDTWPRLNRSLLLQNRFIRLEAWQLRARAALGAYKEDPSNTAALRLARSAIKKSTKDEMVWSAAVRLHTEGTLAEVTGDLDAAVALYRQAIDELDATKQHLRANATRRRLGELVGGDEGQILLRVSDSWFASQGVVDHDAMTRMVLGT